MSALVDVRDILHTEEYCLRAVAHVASLGHQSGVPVPSAGSVLNLALLLNAALFQKQDSLHMIVTSKDSANGLMQKHLVREYVAEDGEIVIRNFLTQCPHGEVGAPSPQSSDTHG